jgi:tetratricopeptide (TPR) repeat protein
MTRPNPIRRTPVRLAWLALLWERAAPVLAGPLLALGVFLVLALFGVFERTGDPVRALALGAVLIAAFVSLRVYLPRFTTPTLRQAERRVEADSALSGRPYEALRDAPASGDAELWAAHRARMAAHLGTAHARRPKAAWARFDAYGARVSLLIVLGAGVFLAGDLAPLRLADAFAPRALSGGGEQASVEFWVEPPEYTGQPVIYLRDRRSVAVPEGSLIAARVTGLDRDPAVAGAPAEIETLSEDVRQITMRPAASGTVVIRAGSLRESVTLTLVPDTPPRVRLAAEPEGDAQGRLKLDFTVEDDFGVETYALRLAAAPESGEPTDDAFETLALSPGDIGPPDGDGVRTATIEVARHPLSGARAVIQLTATDGAGQTGASGRLELTLPSRVFLDPLARAVAAERRGFITVDANYSAMPDGPPDAMSTGFLTDEPERRLERAPAPIQRLSRALDAVSDAPAGYFDDPIVWMGLRTAMREVRRARELTQLSHLDEDLWQIALRAELGSLADAEAALRAAEQALMDAMARGADAMELSALFDAFEQAMANYLQALAREAAEEGRFADGGGGASMNGDRLQALLDALREAAELGDTEGSRRALAQLAELLRNMQVTLSQGGGQGGEEGEIARALREALEELGETLGEQREITGDTFEEAQRQGDQSGSGAGQSGADSLPAPGEQPGEGVGDPSELEPGEGSPGSSAREGGAGGAREGEEEGSGAGALAERQGEIAGAIPGLAGRIPDTGPEAEAAREALDTARGAMEEAARALERGDAEGALGAQERAIDALREAASSASQAFESAEGRRPGQDGPLGRGDAQGAGAETGVPSESERQRAREILEELRRRAAERGRPQDELDYIDRLLERF